jgi:YegS/Rv2252/BmrU family lipid kinase
VEPEKPVLIVNPRSGGGLDEKHWARLVGPLTEGLGPFDVRFTESVGDGRRLAQEAAAAGRTLVVAFGGDGTISEVVDGLIAAGSQRCEMGIIPRGTGGDFRRTLSLPEHLLEAAKHIRQATAHVVDAGRATFIGHDGQRRTRSFINVGSFGFSADVATRANRSGKKLGAKAAFLGATVGSLIGYDNVEVLIRVDGGEPQRRTVLLGAIGNGCYFGGGMKICPQASLDDGLLDLVVVGDFGRVELMTKISHIYAGTHLTLKKVQAVQARTVEVTPVEGSREIAIELDGETPGRLPATFEIVPRALRLRF